MSYHSHILIFLGLIGISKAHHFIRVVVLAALGLAGLWMVHTLAQDFNKIQGHGGLGALGGGSSGAAKFFEKRSTEVNAPNYLFFLLKKS